MHPFSIEPEMKKIILSANTDWYLYNFRWALAEFLRDRDYEVVLLSPQGPYTKDFVQAGFRWIPWEVSRIGLNLFEEGRALFSIWKIYRREKPDIVHHHTIKPVIFGSIAARFAGIPKIVNSISGRGYVFQSTKTKARILKRIVGFLYRLTLKYPNSKVIFENQSDRDDFVNAGYVKAADAYLIEGVGVDPNRFSPMPEPESDPVVLLSGRMLWDKGVDVFVEAARLLKSKVEARFVLVGEPDPGNPESIDEEILREWNEEKVIEWWGWQSDMAAVFAKTHIVVLPTRYGEGVPTFLLEGAACGKPLVASDVPGCRAIIVNGENGVLLSDIKPTNLADALVKLITSPGIRKQMGEKSRGLILNKFTHDHVNLATVQVYDDVFGVKSTSSGAMEIKK